MNRERAARCQTPFDTAAPTLTSADEWRALIGRTNVIKTGSPKVAQTSNHDDIGA
jgi:hypothetical protein